MENNRLRDMYVGQAGVHRVIAELILRHHDPCVPAIDYGYDIVLGKSDVRIQVKTATLTTKKYTGTCYIFRTNGTVSEAITHKRRQVKRKWSDVCDFVILHGLTENRYWIVPAREFDHSKGFFVSGNDRKHRDLTDREDAPAMRDLLNNGKTVEEVAALYGVGVGIVYRVRRGEKISPAGVREHARNIRKLENRWDLIEDFIRTVKCPVPGVLESVLTEGVNHVSPHA